MSRFKIKILEGLEAKDKDSIPEKLHISDRGIKGTFRIYEGISDNFHMAIIPSLNITGYGDNPTDAFKDMEYNTDVFFEDIFALPQYLKDEEFKKLGWSRHKFFKKQYSAAFVDKNGILQNFDNPENVKLRILETA